MECDTVERVCTIPLPINFPCSHPARAGVALPACGAELCPECFPQKVPSLPSPAGPPFPSDPTGTAGCEQGQPSKGIFSEFSILTQAAGTATAQGNEQSRAGTHSCSDPGRAAGCCWMKADNDGFLLGFNPQYYRYNKKGVRRSKPWLGAFHTSSRDSPSLGLGCGASKSSWNWQHHQCSRTQNEGWEAVEALGWLQGRCGAPEAVIPCSSTASTLPGSPKPMFLQCSCKAPLDCTFWAGHTQYSAPSLPLVLQSLLKKKKIWRREIPKTRNPQIPKKLLKSKQIPFVKQSTHRTFKMPKSVLRILSILIIRRKFSNYSMDICISVMMQQCLNSSIYNSVYKLCIHA